MTSLTVAGSTLSPSFDTNTLNYSVILPGGTTIATLPAVMYTPAAEATAVKTDATTLPGATTIMVTAQDGTTQKTYTINFSLATGIGEISSSSIIIHPVPASDKIIIDLPTGLVNSTVSILNVTGITQIETVANETKVSIDVSGLPAGTYLVRITKKDFVPVNKQIFKK